MKMVVDEEWLETQGGTRVQWTSSRRPIEIPTVTDIIEEMIP
jgi:hypothetical protein